MATYYDKKKLLDENSDLYISTYDKSLDAISLSGIIEAKREYENAKNAYDQKGMDKANQKANNIRSKSAGYTGGIDGSEYNKSVNSYESKDSIKFKSSYDDKRNKLADEISNFKDFSYDPEKDPVFKSYQILYSKLGDDAFDRALSKASLKTGGSVNSSAISSAMQAKNSYNTNLLEIIPKLYESAYSKYKDSYERLYKNLDAINGLYDDEYSRYRDSVKDFENDRDYYYKKDKDYNEYLKDIYKTETDAENERYEFDEKQKSDKYELEQNLNYKKEKDKNDLAYKYFELDEKTRANNYNAAINLAKALYGKVPVSQNVINSIFNMIK